MLRVAALGLGLLFGSFGAPTPAAAQSVGFQAYGLADGLPSREIRDIDQDDSGRLWVATRAGVSRYDGRDWTHFGLAQGLSFADQFAIRRDARGDLWAIASAEPFPIYRFTGEAWEQVADSADLVEGAALAGFEVRRDSGDPTWTLATSEQGVLQSVGGRWRRLECLDALEAPMDPSTPALLTPDPSTTPGAIAEGALKLGPRIHGMVSWRGRLWVATDAGLASVENGRLGASALDDQAPTTPVFGLAVERDALWLVGADWIGRITGDEMTLLSVETPTGIAPAATASEPLANPSLDDRSAGRGQDDSWGVTSRDADTRDDGVQDEDAARAAGGAAASRGLSAGIPVVADGTGGLYYGTAEGVRRFHVDRGFADLGRDLAADRPSALHVDRERNLWIGSSRGLTKVPGLQFGAWRELDGTFADSVVSLLERRDGRIVLGHRGGITLIDRDGVPDPRSLPLTTPDQRTLEAVRDLAETPDGALWAAVGERGVLRLAPDGRTTVYGASRGLEAPTAAVAVDGDSVWVGTSDGIRRLDLAGGEAAGGRFESVGPTAPSIKVRRLLVDGAVEQGGGLLIAAADGLYRYDGSWRRWECRVEPGCSSTFSVAPRPGGGWWVGTAVGLYRTEGDRLVPETAPAIDRPVFFSLMQVATDRADGPSPPSAYWFGVDGGVLRWRLDQPERLDSFTVEDGLVGREMQRAAALLDRMGRLWFGTEGGAVVYDPQLDPGRREPPKVGLDTVVLGARRLSLDRPQSLRLHDNDLRFRYRAVSLVDEDRVRVRVRLLGFEDAWVQGDLDETRYTNVPPGEYRFQVQAAAPGSAWSRPATSAPLRVLRPLWLQPWVWALGFLGVLALVISAQRLLSQRRYSARLSREVNQRIAELKASEDRYRKTFRGIDDGVLTADASGRVELLNPRAEQITGWTKDEAVGRPFEDVLSFDHVEVGAPTGGEAAIVDLRDTLGPTTQARLSHRDGHTVMIDLSISPVVDGDGRTVGLVFAFRDVSRRLEIEQELAKAQKLEAVGLLAGGIAHDFNNLLAVLMGNLSMLQAREDLDAEVREPLYDAEVALHRARDLTQQLLTFSRGGAPVREAARLTEVVTESASLILSGSVVKLETDFDPALWIVEIDAGQMSQVLQNLLLNAVQSMSDGGVVRIAGRNFEGEPPSPLAAGRYVTLDVRDEGAGIALERVAKVFDPYFSTKSEGRGLGLASAYSIVKRHDGLLTVHRTGPRGTTFRIYLPASERAAPEPALPIAVSPGRFAGSVLLMDDESTVRRTTAVMLERLGLQVVETADGAEAVDRYARALEQGCRFDVVLTDLTVPGGLGGKATLDRLLELDPSVAAIVTSGYSNDPILANFGAYGFRGRLAKPFRIEALTDALHEVLGPAPER